MISRFLRFVRGPSSPRRTSRRDGPFRETPRSKRTRGDPSAAVLTRPEAVALGSPPPAPLPEAATSPAFQLRTRRVGRVLAFVSLSFLGPFIGEALWGLPVMLLALAFFFWLSPPHRKLPWSVVAIFLGLVVLAALPFLPAGWFKIAPWSFQASALGIPLPATLTSQPWLTLDGLSLLVAGLAWAYAVLSQRWTLAEHRLAVRLLAGSVLLLIVLALVLNYAAATLPFWRSERNFGPFANRNHTANLFALGGLLFLACSFDSLSGSKWAALGWAGSFGLAIVALIWGYSKSGIAMFFVGCSLWAGILIVTSRHRVGLIVVEAIVLIAAVLFLRFGGETLQRFGLSNRGLVATVTEDSRWALQKDALRLGTSAPWCGLGLGNFEDVMPQFRKASYSQARTLHPESDWVWLRVELGWGGLLLVLAALPLVLRHALPLKNGTNQRLRAAALAGTIIFCLQGIVNVPGHRFGLFLPAVFLASLALHPHRPLPLAPSVAPIFRGLAVLLAIVAFASLFALFGQGGWPSRLSKSLLLADAETAYKRGDFPATMTAASRGLQVAPLNWKFYHLRGIARALSSRSLPSAEEDLRRARFLISNSWKVPYAQGIALLSVSPVAAAEPWSETLRRGGDQPADLYGRMLDTARDYPALHRRLTALSIGHRDRQVMILNRLSGQALTDKIASFLASDPSLGKFTPTQRRDILFRWASVGDWTALQEAIQAQPSWLEVVWSFEAKELARQESFAAALSLARQFIAPPTLPVGGDNRDLDALERSFRLNPLDIPLGYRLYSAQLRAGLNPEALATLQHLCSHPECPPYLFYLLADLETAHGDAKRAWTALQQYAPELK